MKTFPTRFSRRFRSRLHERVLLLALASCALACTEGHSSAANDPETKATDSGTSRTHDSASDTGGDAGTGPKATLKSGKIQGKLVGTSAVFLGIPYAKAPVGALRFMPPVPVDPWTSIKQTTEIGDSCPQPVSALAAMNTKSEDCLNLNVYAPASATGKSLPVLVWIHGGGYVSGAGSSPTYDGQRLSEEGPAVIVTLNYRLGALGFLSHPELDKAHGDVPSGNDALRDQQLALRWVQDNIAAFHGDPDNVTLFGQSAGSSSVCFHLVSPTSAGLAKRYILESGSCIGSFLGTTKEEADKVGTELGEALCDGESDVIACLRGKDATDVVEWGKDRGVSGAGWKPVVNADDELLPDTPTKLIAEGKHSQGPVLLGTTKNEWALFVQLQGAMITTLDIFDKTLAALFPAPLVTAIKAHYPATDATAAGVFVSLMTDAMFRCPTRSLARAVSSAGNTVYLYSFEEGAAFHAYEIPFVFGNPSAALGITDVEDMHAVMKDYWIHYAQKGDPNGGDQPAWPLYDTDNEAYLTLQASPEAGKGLGASDCDFWDQAIPVM